MKTYVRLVSSKGSRNMSLLHVSVPNSIAYKRFYIRLNSFLYFRWLQLRIQSGIITKDVYICYGKDVTTVARNEMWTTSILSQKVWLFLPPTPPHCAWTIFLARVKFPLLGRRVSSQIISIFLCQTVPCGYYACNKAGCEIIGALLSWYISICVYSRWQNKISNSKT
jgi:hypothetical protein